LTAQTLADEGHHVFASMREVKAKNAAQANSLTQWAKENGADITIVELDVTSDESVKAAAKSILSKTGGKLDVIVNNAGIYGMAFQETFTVEDYKTNFDVNVFGPARINNEFLPVLRKQGSGLIIHISSVLGRIIVPFSGVYHATKWAVEALAENLHYELAPLGIDSVIVQPGPFYTELFGKPYQPANLALADEYGATKEYFRKFYETFGGMMGGDNLPNKPQHVADAISKLINTPQGERPLRTVVDKMMNGSAEILNETAGKVQEGVLGGLGLGDLLQTKKETIAA